MQFTAATQEELLDNGLAALGKLMAREPRWVELSVLVGKHERFLSEQVDADFAQVTEWLDGEAGSLLQRIQRLSRAAGRSGMRRE